MDGWHAKFECVEESRIWQIWTIHSCVMSELHCCCDPPAARPRTAAIMRECWGALFHGGTVSYGHDTTVLHSLTTRTSPTSLITRVSFVHRGNAKQSYCNNEGRKVQGVNTYNTVVSCPCTYFPLNLEIFSSHCWYYWVDSDDHNSRSAKYSGYRRPWHIETDTSLKLARK